MALVKALLEVVKGSNRGLKVAVHFNPSSLRVSYHTTGSVGTVNGDQQVEKQEVTAQQTGYGSDLSLELLFDTSQNGSDVRSTTLKLVEMISPKTKNMNKSDPPPIVPIVRFNWGTFLFTGTISSMDETLDLFSEQGVPLRSTVNLSMSEVALESDVLDNLGSSAGSFAGEIPGIGAGIGTTPLTLSQAGDTLQNLVGSIASGVSWKAIASANNVDNPRLIQPGTVLNLRPRIR